MDVVHRFELLSRARFPYIDFGRFDRTIPKFLWTWMVFREISQSALVESGVSDGCIKGLQTCDVLRDKTSSVFDRRIRHCTFFMFSENWFFRLAKLPTEMKQNHQVYIRTISRSASVNWQLDQNSLCLLFKAPPNSLLRSKWWYLFRLKTTSRSTEVT